MRSAVQGLIEELGLEPHPEGGYFRETHRSSIRVQTGSATRSALTSILFLLSGEMFSAFHRLASDEIWHHYHGAPVAIEVIDGDGQHRQEVIGKGNQCQAVIEAGSWFAAHVCDENGYALKGCDVAPGFAFEDFELASREDLLAAFPEHASLIERWTRPT